MIDTATQAGANHVESVRFTVRDSQVLHSQALREATLKAKADAEAVAAALNMKINRIVSVDDTADSGGPSSSPMAMNALGDGGGPAPTPVQPGTFVATANITLTVEVATR